MDTDKYTLYNKAKQTAKKAVELDSLQEYEEAYRLYLKVSILFTFTSSGKFAKLVLKIYTTEYYARYRSLTL